MKTKLYTYMDNADKGMNLLPEIMHLQGHATSSGTDKESLKDAKYFLYDWKRDELEISLALNYNQFNYKYLSLASFATLINESKKGEDKYGLDIPRSLYFGVYDKS